MSGLPDIQRPSVWNKLHVWHPVLFLLGSNLLGTLAGGVFFLFASWYFDLATMGHYAFMISLQMVLSGVIGSAMGVTIIRLSVDHLAVSQNARAAGVVALGAGVGLAATLVLAAVVVAVFFETMSLADISGFTLVLVALWAGGRSVLDCLRSGLLASGRYRRVVLLALLSACSGLVFLGLMLLTGPFTLQRLLLAHVLGQGAGALAGVRLLHPLWRAGIQVSRAQLREMVQYARWPALSEGAMALQAHVGPLLLVAVAGAEEAGVFSLGRYPAFLFGMVGLSLYQYWLPQAAREGADRQLDGFLGRQMRLALFAGLAIILGAVLIRPLLPLLGDNFAAGAPLLLPNAADFALGVLILPIGAAYHGLRKPYLEFYIKAVRLLALLGAALLLAARYGAPGMAWAHVLSTLAVLGLALWLYRQHPHAA